MKIFTITEASRTGVSGLVASAEAGEKVALSPARTRRRT